MFSFKLALLLLILTDNIIKIPLFLHQNSLPSSYGHGRLILPASRASMWRYGYDTLPDYNDNQAFCGGVQVSSAMHMNGSCVFN